MIPHIYIRYPERKEWYARFKVRGKAYLWNTKTDDKATAKVRAKQYRDNIVAGAFHLAAVMKVNSGCPTFEELFESYKTLPIPANARTRRDNIAAMMVVLRANGLSPKDRVDRLGATMATTYQEKCLKTLPGAIGNDAMDRHGAIVSCNSRLRQSRALFSRRAMSYYPATFGLPKERIDEFKNVLPMIVGERQRPLPDATAMANAENPTTGLPATDKACWSAYLLAKYTGMRSCEIKVARWDWIKDGVLGVGGLDGVATTKSKRFRAVRMDPSLLAILQANKTSDLYIVSNNPRMTIERRLLPMLRAYGFDMVDPMHSLRRWHASWRLEHQGAASARDALGHATESMTMKHYARFINAPAAIPLGGIVAVPSSPSPAGQSG